MINLLSAEAEENNLKSRSMTNFKVPIEEALDSGRELFKLRFPHCSTVLNFACTAKILSGENGVN